MVRVDKQLWLVILLLATTAALRAGFLWSYRQNLSADADAYLAIADNLGTGKGYVHPATNEPTAYRPPLYPLVISLIVPSGNHERGIALLHFVLGTATVLVTWRIGVCLGLGASSCLAAAIVAVDPLLLQYSTLVMSETLCAFLIALVLLLSHIDRQGSSSELTGAARLSRSRAAALGCVLGLCVLCRPAIWAFVAVLAIWWLQRCRQRTTHGDRAGWDRGGVATIGIAAVVMIATVSPWFLRNLIVFRHPILTTTHGGYTMLLGNNPVFYREVVAKPWGTVWDDAGPDSNQAAWYQSLQEQMGKELGQGTDELDRDRWMYGRAWKNIRDEPALFLRACGLRVLRLWNVVPLGSAAVVLSQPVRWGIVGFYVLTGLGCAMGLYKSVRHRQPAWAPVLLLLGTLTIVHLLYWANMRMRAPLIPAIALLSVYGWGGLWRAGSTIRRGRDE